MNTSKLFWHLVTLSLFLLAAPSHACNVPVFRYALERWRADPYEVIVFHRGPLEPADRAIVDGLQKYVDSDDFVANFALEVIDLATSKDADLVALFEKQPDAAVPWMVVRYPLASRVKENVWAGRLDGKVVSTLIDSPVRREVARRILKGESAVWLLLESGNPEKDNAAAELIQAHLTALEKTLMLPERTKEVADRLLIENGLPLRIAFSMLRVSRTDPAEKMLVEMLLHTEEDLPGRPDPMAFAVFGRGRVLYALVGAGITRDNLEEDATFLTEACKCETKGGNPGIDLLISADWEALIDGRVVEDPPPPPLVGLAGLSPTDRKELPNPSKSEVVEEYPRPINWLLFAVVVTGVGGLLFLAIATAFVLTMGKRVRS